MRAKDRADRDHRPSRDVKMMSILHVRIVFPFPLLLPPLLLLFGCRVRSKGAASATAGCPSLFSLLLLLVVAFVLLFLSDLLQNERK